MRYNIIFAAITNLIVQYQQTEKSKRGTHIRVPRPRTRQQRDILRNFARMPSVKTLFFDYKSKIAFDGNGKFGASVSVKYSLVNL